jgi:hypothetical protein
MLITDIFRMVVTVNQQLNSYTRHIRYDEYHKVQEALLDDYGACFGLLLCLRPPMEMTPLFAVTSTET